MPLDIKIPALGDGIAGGDVVNLLVKPGESVQEGQGLIEIETGKATVEVPSPAAGVVVALTVKVGDKGNVGDRIGTLETGTAAPAPAPATAPASAPAKSAAATPTPAPAPAAAAGPAQDVPVVIPNLGDGVAGGDVVNLLAAPGDTVQEGQGLIEIETGKATVEVPAPAAGTVKTLSVKVGDKAKVGDTIAVLAAAGGAAAPRPAAAPSAPAAPAPAKAESAPSPAPAPVAPPARAAERPAHAPIPAAPSVRKFAREIGVELREVPGSGAAGRISIDDVKAWSRRLNQGGRSAAPAAGAVAAKPLPDFRKFGEITVEKMSTIRRMTVQHMATCWSTIPHVTQFDEADVGPLEKLRARFNKVAEPKGVKLTVTALLLKILAQVMKAHSKFNASLDVAREEIILKGFVNIGVAVDTPKGLVVPVLRNVDQKSLLQIGTELKTYADKVKAGKIAPDDLAGGGMTLTNLGGLGGKHFTPIVNAPEVAILGLGRAEFKPVWDTEAGAFVPRAMMPISLSYDHRLIDGADGTRFLRALVDAVEMPMLSLE
jgi:pyruvate dehydrogenase E2 component (dihydrolipoamide acetyltransferase)